MKECVLGPTVMMKLESGSTVDEDTKVQDSH